MSRQAAWKQLPADKAHAFLDAVRDEAEAALFDPSLCEVHALPLSFYDGYSLTRIVNKHMIPFLLLDYLSNGEKHYYLDGSDQAFQNLNAQGAISLNKDNVRDYTDLYISYVYERGHSLDFISDPHDTSYKGSAAMDIHFRAITHHQETKIEHDAAQNRYTITAPLIYQDQTVQGRIEVAGNGAIHVLEPLTVSFLEQPQASAAIAYRHPGEAKIAEQAFSLLTAVPTGEALLKIAADKDFQIRVLASPNYHGFTTNSRVIYIIQPAAKLSADYLQALVLAACIRDAEQMDSSLFRPHPDISENDYALMNYGKNLDMIVQMCKIVEEFEGRNILEPLHELRKMGFESLYSAHKNRFDDRGMMAAYMDVLRRYGYIEG